MDTNLELILRIVVAGALGAIIGYERNRHHRSAGLRTHMVVAIASATFMVVSHGFHEPQGFDEGDGLLKVDASRIASQVVTGAGFIAGGAILRSGPTVQGLTTAAGLWLVTAIGLAAGARMYMIAASVTGLGVVALWLLRKVETGGEERQHGKVRVELAGEASLAQLSRLIEAAGARVITHDYVRNFGEAQTEVTFFVNHGDRFDTDALVNALGAAPNMRSVRVETMV
jgi:putative Mg2+ transporter-C (MgtC) family protein